MTDQFDPHFDAEPAACPFVAFEDDRDHRSDAPDYRHRCFASAEPEPRAFPHQENYCLSAGFTGCPVFLDWARQEAAGVARSDGATDGAVAAAAALGDEAAPAFLSTRPKATVPAEASRRTAEASAGLWSNEGGTKRTTPTAPPAPNTIVVPPVAMARRGPTHPGWENPPHLENFPRLRSRDERHSNAPLIGAAVGVAVLMVALVLVPLIFSSHGGGTPTNASGSPNSSSSSDVAVGSPTLASSTPTAGPSFQLYTVNVKKGDLNMTAVAQKFNTSPAAIVAFNVDKGYAIDNVNVIWDGMQFYIPPVGWTPPPSTPAPTPTPKATATPTPTPTPR